MNMPMITQFQENQKTMSSREIAELCEKEHFNVKRDCEVMFKGLQLDALKFEGIYLDAQLEPLNFEGIVNSTTPNLNPMGYAQNWTHLKMFGGV